MIWPYASGARTRSAAALLDGWLPPGSIQLERHGLVVPAPPAATLAAIDDVRWNDLPAVRALFTLRGLPHEGEGTVHGFFSTPPFVLLEEAPGREVAFGVLGPFWRWRRGAMPDRVARDPAGFRAALGDGVIAALGNYRVEPAAGGTLLSTETWVSAPVPAQRAAFTAYWLAVGPFSAWIRRMLLRAAARRATRTAARPG